VLAKEVARELGTTLGTCHIEKYPDGELDIEVRDDLRHAHVFLIQTLHAPVGKHLLELSLIADACHRAGAPKVTAVIPYLGYARQDRRESETEPLGARVVAQMLGAGLTVDSAPGRGARLTLTWRGTHADSSADRR
jgi:ribose-phosphate pyrophosphokinase